MALRKFERGHDGHGFSKLYRKFAFFTRFLASTDISSLPAYRYLLRPFLKGRETVLEAAWMLGTHPGHIPGQHAPRHGDDGYRLQPSDRQAVDITDLSICHTLYQGNSLLSRGQASTNSRFWRGQASTECRRAGARSGHKSRFVDLVQIVMIDSLSKTLRLLSTVCRVCHRGFPPDRRCYRC